MCRWYWLPLIWYSWSDQHISPVGRMYISFGQARGLGFMLEIRFFWRVGCVSIRGLILSRPARGITRWNCLARRRCRGDRWGKKKTSFQEKTLPCCLRVYRANPRVFAAVSHTVLPGNRFVSALYRYRTAGHNAEPDECGMPDAVQPSSTHRDQCSWIMIGSVCRYRATISGLRNQLVGPD